MTCPSQSTCYHWNILNSCLLCGMLFERLRLSCDNPFSWRSWGATPNTISRRLPNVLRRSLDIRTQKCRGWENTDCSIKEMRWDGTEEEHTVVLFLLLSENKGPLDVPIVSVPTRSDHSGPFDCEEPCAGSLVGITSAPYRDTCPRRGTTTTSASCSVCSISRAFQGPSSSATD